MRFIKKHILFTLTISLALSITSCNDFFDIKPSTFIPTDDVWSDPDVVNSIIAEMYANLQLESFFYSNGFFDFDQNDLTYASDEAAVSWPNGIFVTTAGTVVYGDDWFYMYGDTYKGIRQCNTFIRQAETAAIDPSQKKSVVAEARFIRAFHYFNLVKRFGGVPLITEAQEYSSGDDITNLQVPRNKEDEIWNFIYTEMEEIKDMLPEERSEEEKYRITRYAAYALQSRACLYAASIAKYGTLNEDCCVGVPANKADFYWEAAVTAANKVINSNGKYELYGYDVEPESRTENFHQIFFDESSANKELIWVKGFALPDVYHGYTKYYVPFSFTHNGYGCCGTPTLEFVEAFEYTDGSKGTLKVQDEQGHYIKYNNLNDIFKDKDPRLAATVCLPGDKFQNSFVEVRRGIAKNLQIPDLSEWVNDKSKKGQMGDGQEITYIGKDGPTQAEDPTKTGFYARKFVDEDVADYERCTNPWPVFRVAEMYLNVAEAEFELNHLTEATTALNMVRHRAGIKELSEGEVTLDRIRNERRVELAYESHRYWDLRRWRIAATPRADGKGTGVLDNLPVTALFPWAVYEDGTKTSEIDGRIVPVSYIFSKEEDPSRVNRPRKQFLERHYYLKFKDEELKTNPKLVQNPYF